MNEQHNNRTIKNENIDSNIFQSLFENSLSGILYGNPNSGDVIDANPAAALMFGYTIDELKTLNRRDIFDANDSSMINSLKSRKENGFAKGELIGVRKNGERFPCEFTSSIFKNNNGENRTSTILNDVSERRKSEDEMSLLLDNTQESFVLIDKHLKIVSFNKYFYKQYKYLLNKEVKKGDSILDYSIPERKNSIANIYHLVLEGQTIEDNAEFEDSQGDAHFYSIVYKPARNSNGEIVGIFLTTQDITSKTLAVRDKVEEIRNREALINLTYDLIWSVDLDFKLIAANQAFLNTMKIVLNVDLKTGDNLLFKEKIDQDFVLYWKQMYLRGFSGESFKFETISPEKYQSVIYMETTINPIYDGDIVVGVACYSRDITKAKIAFQQLKENKEEIKRSHEQLSKLTDSIETVVYQFEISLDGKMTFPFISKSINKLVHNLDLDVLKHDATPIFETIHPDDREELIASIFVSKNSLQDWNYEFRYVMPDEGIKWIKGCSHPFLQKDGTVIWYGYLLDVTHRKAEIEQLRIANDRYHTISKATNDTIWDIDYKSNTIQWNDGLKTIFGYNENEPKINDLNWWYSKIHPDDIALVKQQSDYWLKTKKSRWEFEYRFLCADNTFKYVFDRGFLLLDSKGEPTRMIGSMQDITERKTTERALLESQKRFKTIFEAVPECLKLIGSEGNLIEINQAGLEMLEVNSLNEINKCNLVDFVLPKYKNDFITLTRDALNGKKGKFEFEILGRLGTKRWMETIIVPMFDSNNNVNMALAVTRDITQRKKEEHLLKLLESVITNTSDSVMITTIESYGMFGPKIVYVNDAFVKMTGYSKDEIEGKSPRILQGSKSERSELKKLSSSMSNFQSSDITIINYRKSGEEFWVNFSVSPLSDENGVYTHWIAVGRDVTQKKIDDIEREMIISELSQNNKDLKQFSYVTSHNLRAPIANLLGLTSLIEHYKVPNKSLKQILDGVRQSALMFDETVKDLTNVLVIKDKTNIAKEKLFFVNTVNNVLNQLSIAVDDQSVRINYVFDQAPFVEFTSSYLESILLNLFTNAMKYKSPSRKLKIDITTFYMDNYIVMTFEDNGLGIDTDLYKDKLFKLYQRFHDNIDGKGLGLYLVKSQMEALGGTIDLESKVGKGTKFIMKFRK